MKRLYQAFSDHEIGNYHVKKGTVCEDSSIHYCDPEKKYIVASICDGHSPDLCFRSYKGSEFGCRVAKEELTAFFDAYCDADEEEKKAFLENPDYAIKRLKQAVVLKWRDYVHGDLEENPIKPEEWALLKEKEREVYQSGQHLEEIYGATFLAAGLCDDFYILMHIGDGMVITVKNKGNYLKEIPDDPRSQYGSPESLCDNDLLTRAEAFRVNIFTDNNPEAVFLSSDGIEDSAEWLRIKLEFRTLMERFIQNIPEEIDQLPMEVNEEQNAFLKKEVTYYTLAGNGAEDDCSLAGFYLVENPIPEVVMTEEEEKEWKEYRAMMEERKAQKAAGTQTNGKEWNQYSEFNNDNDGEFGLNAQVNTIGDTESQKNESDNMEDEDLGELPDPSKKA